MIPKITRSRTRLKNSNTSYCYLNEYEDSAYSFFVLPDTYPELFELSYPNIVAKAPGGWKDSSSGKMRYLWFPPDELKEEDIEYIEDWKERFEQYVLLGKNRHIKDFFSDDLDFCMALDFNFDPAAERRTYYGEAEYQLKYRNSRPHFNALKSALVDALQDLPIPLETSYTISSIPATPGICNVSCKLSGKIAEEIRVDYIQADLLCEKNQLKALPLEKKISEWKRLYSNPKCIKLSADVDGKTVVIIDDLYQSGITMWCYAKYLKKKGAKHVLGIVCVKSLRDSDNQ